MNISYPKQMKYGQVVVVFDRIIDGYEEKGFVPLYHFKIYNTQSEQVGHINVRVGDTNHIKFAAGHIGYELIEAYRGHGYAREACLALASWVEEAFGNVLITVDPDNLASIRTIERIGAQFVDEVYVPEKDPHYLRGSFRKRRYHWSPQNTESS